MDWAEAKVRVATKPSTLSITGAGPEVVFRATRTVPPKLSIVLLDWSCRESFHTLRYLQQQSVPRDRYEVIWIEYYSRRSPELADAIKGEPPSVDQWIVLGIPADVYYAKHLMYNVGIMASRGAIVTLCDSDAMMRPTFVETILAEFDQDPDIVLHMDQVRNNDQSFYPFRHPSFEEVEGPGAINWTGTTTTGLLDTVDPLHSRNYGACMCARRADLIAIGGADEHIDYVGHICGPYDLTFRLVNAGKREVWHPREVLYHTWHPGQAGAFNYLGPHDGRHMSTTSLEARRSGRVLPLIENPAIQMVRLRRDVVEYATPSVQAIPELELPSWTIAALERRQREAIPRQLLRDPRVVVPLAAIALKMVWRQGRLKVSQLSRRTPYENRRRLWTLPAQLARRLAKGYGFLGREAQHVAHVIRQAQRCLDDLAKRDVRAVALCGATEVAEILALVAGTVPMRIAGVYDEFQRGHILGYQVLPTERLQEYDGTVIIASAVDIDRRLDTLHALGIERDRIVTLQ